jgi:Asp-tRNA(Asn)/Glu-tRNA(Gln) amidotransferase A subunit family amidase
LSLGTQTAGSVIRPASFCGAFGFKPSHGRYPAQGVIETSHRLDTVGTFARCVADLALADLVLADEAETASSMTGRSPSAWSKEGSGPGQARPWAKRSAGGLGGSRRRVIGSSASARPPCWKNWARRKR